MKRTVGIIVLALLAAAALAAPGAAGAVGLQQIGSFDEPTYLTSDPGNPERLFVAERGGRMLLVEGGSVTTFADLSSELGGVEGEQGLLSIALAPDFDSSGRLFAYYAGRADAGAIHVAELKAGGSFAPLWTLREILTIPHPEDTNHYGGQLQFGPEGMLFVSTGDGGGANDRHRNAQDRSSLLGKILRLDVRSPAFSFRVPPGNPFAGSADPDERLVFAYGLRNPYRFSFDRLEHDLVIGDVGQSAREEVDWARAANGLGAGANYGWSCREGGIAGPASDPACTAAAAETFVDPVFDYPHLDPGGGRAHGVAIIGGYVNRDPGLPELAGRYVYGDLGGEIRSLLLPQAYTSDFTTGLRVADLNSFGEDSCGRLYAISGNGPVYRIVGSGGGSCGAPAPPRVAEARQLAPSAVGIRAVTRRVKRRGRAQISVWVLPCKGRQGERVRLLRGRVRVGSRRLDRACTAHFLPRVPHRAVFRAEIRADGTYEAARSRRLRIRVYRPRRKKVRKHRPSLHIPAGVGRR